MTPARFEAITSRYPSLRLAVVGDFCLDRYFDIDPERQEISIETGLEVHNISRVRCQPGAAGTILNNLAALGVGTLWPVGFCGEDGEGWELRRALLARSGVSIGHFEATPLRHTFTYTKPLIHVSGQPPTELNRLDLKNWSPTPDSVQGRLCDAVEAMAKEAQGILLMDQVDVPETGVVTQRLLASLRGFLLKRPDLLVVADSRRGLRDWPPVVFKMNAAELTRLTGQPTETLDQVQEAAASLARLNHQPVFITLAERGIVGASSTGTVAHVPAHPIRGPIDIVGAGDSVTANLTAALAAGADLREAMELAMAAASIVVHQLGTTGTATVDQIRGLLR
jgi:rfaE bifunctional protein kinase chain/domain